MAGDLDSSDLLVSECERLSRAVVRSQLIERYEKKIYHARWKGRADVVIWGVVIAAASEALPWLWRLFAS